MKIKSSRWLLALAFATVNSQPATAHAQGTAFTYQGRLNDGANPASGIYDLTFALYDTNQSPGNLIAGPLTNSATAISNGLFAAVIDFGAGVFTGTNYWLEIGVQTNGGGGGATLTPRQALTPTPYAITAGSVVSGGLAAGTYGNAVTLDNADNNIAGIFSGDGSGLASVNAYSLNGLTSASFWEIGGNAGANPTNGAFIGTLDNLPLEFDVNTNRVLRLEYGYDSNAGSAAPNVIGGSAGNVVSNGFCGALIAGGGNATYPNRVGGSYASVPGGLGNTASGDFSIAMGAFCAALAPSATAIGDGNTASGTSSTALGVVTTASGYASTAMGENTFASGPYSTVLGYANTASGYASSALGNGSTASGDYSTALGYGTKAAGFGSMAMGYNTIANGSHSVTMGESTLTYGVDSTATGYFTQAIGDYSFAGGDHAVANHNGSFVWADSSSADIFANERANQFVIRASGGVGIGTTAPPPGGLQVASGGLAVTGASSPNYPGAQGVFVENAGTFGAVYAFDYVSTHALPLCLNSPGGNVGVGTTAPTHLFQVGNAYCDGNTWAPSSDRNLKAGFQSVDAQAVLAKVAALPITNWHYTNDITTPHLGPMAQDFYAAFNVGADDKHITTVDEGGVALAAIQGLNQKLEAQLNIKDAEIAELQSRLEKLEQLITGKNGGALFDINRP